ncbi:hypothetical protein C0Q70_00650 [Pomacea canaliculata]|uniref:Uncharacterized protein n=1 Tax=Pomacea canaliculata TaxID=400727 RepID=A0A2T7PXB7_POMCA|nr:hypothetical protein C0Q70_00650 [Pomacea canaliculata]
MDEIGEEIGKESRDEGLRQGFQIFSRFDSLPVVLMSFSRGVRPLAPGGRQAGGTRVMNRRDLKNASIPGDLTLAALTLSFTVHCLVHCLELSIFFVKEINVIALLGGLLPSDITAARISGCRGAP